MAKRLEDYLRRVGSYLADEDREEILLEIRTHILERAGSRGEPTAEEVDRVLDDMPPPRAMAASYSEGQEIIAPELRNFLFLYTGILFAVHLGLTVVASIAGTTLALFPFFYAPATHRLSSILLFLPFAFVFDFGLVSLFLFAISQWAPNLSLPVPEAPAIELEPPPRRVLLLHLLALGFLGAAWRYHGPLVARFEVAGSTTVIAPAREILLLPLVLVMVGMVFTVLRMVFASRVLPALGATTNLAAIWAVNTSIKNPAVFHVSGEPWAVLNPLFFKGLLILSALLATLDLAKKVIPVFAGRKRARTVSFRKTGREDWTATMVRLLLFVGVLVGGSLLLLPLGYGPIVWIVMVNAALVLLVFWHNRTFGYKCANCGKEFEIGALVNFVSPHGIGKNTSGLRGWKWLRCPKCRRFSRATVLRKEY